MITIDDKGKTTISLHNGWECCSTDGHTWEYLFKAGAEDKKPKEQPAFDVINGIEDMYSGEFAKMTISIVKDVAKYLNK